MNIEDLQYWLIQVQQNTQTDLQKHGYRDRNTDNFSCTQCVYNENEVIGFKQFSPIFYECFHPISSKKKHKWAEFEEP